MNICVITSAHPVYDKRIFRQIKSCLDQGILVSYIVPITNESEIKKKYEGLSFLPIKKGGKIRRGFNQLNILYKALKTKSDLYHLHDPDLMFIGIILTKLGRNVIFDVHEHYADKFLLTTKIPVFLRRNFYNAYLNVENWCAGKIRNLVVVEDSQVQRFSRMKNINTEIVYNYPSLKKPIVEPELTKENMVIIHSGSLSEHRGSLIIIELARKIKSGNLNYKIYLIDLFYSINEEEKMKKLIDTYQLNDIITFFPKRPQEDIYSFLKKGAVGISFLLDIPKYQKGIPTKLFEYMACGLPIIASNLHYSEKYITANKCGLTNQPEDIDGYLDSINRISNNFDYYSNNSYLAFEKYKWETEAEKLIAFYKIIINKIDITVRNVKRD